MQLDETILVGLRIMRGHVVGISRHGDIEVEGDSDGALVSCNFLRTVSGPLPHLKAGDAVLYAIEESGIQGYVLGCIQKYCPIEGVQVDAVREHNVKELKFNAEHRIELRCGKSSLTMKQDGNIYVKGTRIVTRASETQKIKGATVQIN